MFLGIDMFSGKYAMTPSRANIKNVNGVRLADGTYDHLYINANAEKELKNIFDDWEFSTKINAHYTDSLDGGNSGFSLKNTSQMIIKCRERGSIEWITLFMIPVRNMSDFDFSKEYYYGSADTDYEFMIISISSDNAQNSYETTRCYSDFEGICIADKNTFYKTMFNIEPMSTVRNVGNNTVNLLNETYPSVISNSQYDYESGTISAVFLKQSGEYIFASRKEASIFRKKIINWLTNNRTKVLKYDNGKNLMIKIVGQPTESEGEHPELVKLSFSFIEVGDLKSETHLYKNNLSDVSPNRR